ncbi:HlyD family efflux transporter periplasmic adaptor subunit [Paenibacillus sp. OT2-17]|uniref:HlyD family secretion protein n=1 Tax=unclassified Paenibacillus TaxID=185978 RepID=UPI0013560ACE|nr:MULTISPECIES: HlyD family secretion protein [unclassified Paenibacillus]MBP1173122.1 HlyD family secretion protein [Paenibacillus sp. PvR133]MXO79206.1 HlyD family efflux transporter periplasmic adaptor subunit [Paenibacillus sp. OT2-17]
MNRTQVASLIIPVISIACLIGGGFLLQTNGQDQVNASRSVKGTTLNADSIHVSFEQVGGKILNIPVTEETKVKKGTVLMTLDSKDVDLQIEQLRTQIAQFNTQISQQQQSIHLGYTRAATQEKQAQLDIAQAQVTERKSQAALQRAQAAERQATAAEQQVNNGARDEDVQQQRIAVASATKNVQTAQTNYKRNKALYDAGSASKAALDDAESSLTLATNQLSQQKESLQKLLHGATSEERMQASEQTTQAAVSVKQAEEEIRGAQLSVDRSKTQLETIQQSRQQLADQKLAIDLLKQQKDTQEVQLKTLLLKKERLVLKAPQDGKVTSISTKVGENVAQGAPVITLETNDLYYDLYVNEEQAGKFKANQEIKTHISGLNKDLKGTVRYVTAAPQFANVKMSREKGEADTATFQVRVYVTREAALLPGMTVEVNTNEISS